MLMRDFNMTEDQAMTYPTLRAFALAAFHAENNPHGALERTSPGYLCQEAQRIREQNP